MTEAEMMIQIERVQIRADMVTQALRSIEADLDHYQAEIIAMSKVITIARVQTNEYPMLNEPLTEAVLDYDAGYRN